ncbi:MAG: zf-HC2 domain-containing protein [Acidimicrobiales bacterium]
MKRFHRVRWASALEALLDDELDPRRLGRVLAHLQDCPECLAELEALVRLRQSLRRLAHTRRPLASVE